MLRRSALEVAAAAWDMVSEKRGGFAQGVNESCTRGMHEQAEDAVGFG
jgi:hypothetical protein